MCKAGPTKQRECADKRVLAKIVMDNGKGTTKEQGKDERKEGKGRNGKVKRRGAKRVSPTLRFRRKISLQAFSFSCALRPLGDISALPLGYMRNPLGKRFVPQNPQTLTYTCLCT